jgi:trimeric autotransporter adhesin
MFKNTTRRGLAIGAALSLALTGLVASPAQANTPFELKPSAGTSYTTFVDETFELEAVLGTGNGANSAQLKFAVTKAAGFAVGATSSVTAGAAVTAGAVASASTSHVLTNVGAGLTTRNYLRLAIDGATTASASVTVAVTAFIDTNNNGAVDAGEPQSAQTVTFAKYSDVASVVTVTQGAEGDTTVKATAAFTGVNESQLTASDKRVHFAVSGSALASSVAATAGVFTSIDTLTLAKNATVSAEVTYRGTKVGATSATMTVTNKTVQALTLSAVVGDNVAASGSAAAKARINTAFALKANVKDAATTTASAVAGADIVFEVSTSAVLSATKTLAVNGTTYTVSTSLPKTLTIKSDASGDAVVNLLPTGFSTSDTVTLIAKSQNNTTPNMVVSFETATFTAAADGHGFLKVLPGATITVNYSVKDQWGTLSTRADRLQVTDGTTTRYVNLSGGKAAASFTASTSNTTLTVTNPDVQEQNTSTLNWGPVAGAVTASGVAVEVSNVADSFDGVPAATTSATISRVITTGDLKLSSAVPLTGSVNHAGAVVTVTGTGVKFAAAGDKAVSLGSITLNTDGSGHFTVSAFVHTAGKTTVTYTVGSATKSTEITVAAATMTEGKKLSVVVVSGENAAPGSTVRAKAVLTDEYDNPVATENGTTASFGVTIAGPGFIGTLPTKTGSNGESAEFSVLLGSGDTSGNVTITATYDADAAGTGAAITTVKTVTIGSPAVNAVIGSFKGRWAVRVENASGSTIAVKAGGKWYKYVALNDNYLFSRKSRVGASAGVSVYVNGSLENTETITVK